MNIYFCDDNARLNDEIVDLMQKAADFALETEFRKEIEELALEIESVPVDLSVSIVSNEEIQELNRDYRGIDKITDVLSFPQFADADGLIDEFNSPGGVLLGDVVICYDRALEQAEEYGTGIRRELVYLFVHSIFHLFGYDHMEDDEKTAMRAREEAVLQSIGLSR